MSARRSKGKKGAEEDVLFGRNPIREILKFSPERLRKVLVAESDGKTSADDIIEMLESQEVQYEFVPRAELSHLTDGAVHQGFVGLLRPRGATELKDFLNDFENRESGIVVALDSVFDPNNLGTILRAAECFGADAVLWSKNRGASLTPAARKASVGASELVTCIVVSNLHDAILKLKKSHFWIVGAHAAEEATSLPKFDFPDKAVIVLGSEGEGIQSLVVKQCDYQVAIPQFGRIDSLNVSQAAAVLLYSYRLNRAKSSVG